MLNKKAETLKAPNIIYIFVALNELCNPEYHIVPSEYLAQKVYESHKEWLATPGVKGQPHNDNPTRSFSDKENHFLNKWENLIY